MSFTNKDFNPSGDPRVDAIKATADLLARIVTEQCPEGPLRDKAVIDIQSASMFSVKSLFS